MFAILMSFHEGYPWEYGGGRPNQTFQPAVEFREHFSSEVRVFAAALRGLECKRKNLSLFLIVNLTNIEMNTS